MRCLKKYGSKLHWFQQLWLLRRSSVFGITAARTAVSTGPPTATRAEKNTTSFRLFLRIKLRFTNDELKLDKVVWKREAAVKAEGRLGGLRLRLRLKEGLNA